jgi:hypothetical protein
VRLRHPESNVEHVPVDDRLNKPEAVVPVTVSSGSLIDFAPLAVPLYFVMYGSTSPMHRPPSAVWLRWR